MPIPLYRRLLTLICATILLAGCASLAPRDTAFPLHASGIPTEAESCRDILNTTRAAVSAALDPADIRLFNWNIRKSSDEASLGDLDALASGTDLVLIQEAALDSGVTRTVESAKHMSFAPGYQTRAALTGVMTLSSAEPVNRCNFTNYEPWLRSPKATSVTEYALYDTDETLAVVNIHAINFTFGTRHFREQFEEVATALRDHTGPVIVSGDFNTWRQSRLDIVNEIGEEMQLRPVSFDDDARTVRFGFKIDHVYVRGLTAIESGTHPVSTSDHNAMSVRLATYPPASDEVQAW